MSFKMSFKKLFIVISGVSLAAMLIYQVLSPYQQNLVNDLMLCPQKIPYKEFLWLKFRKGVKNKGSYNLIS